jgi:wyosine [tRNA(Phe)-imidazoG37] synthetase (radical SAM superfamily)
VQAPRALGNLFLFNLCYSLGIRRLPYPPLLINLEPTNLCNLRCPFCPVSQNATNPGVSRGCMEMELFHRIVEDIASFRPEIALNMGGESTLHPELERMIEVLKAAGLYVFLDTNATRLPPRLCSRMIDARLDKIVFCLDGDSKASYEAMRVRGRFEETVENIRRFLSLRRQKGSRLPYTVIKNIRYYDPNVSAEFPARFAELFADCPPDEFRFTWADHWPGSHREQLAAPYAAEPYRDDYSPCINLWKKLAISWDGMVFVCCLDLNRTVPIGSVQELGVRGVWNAARMQQLRASHARGEQADLSLCRNCNQIRRRPDGIWSGLLSAGEDRFTSWSRRRPKPLPCREAAPREET